MSLSLSTLPSDIILEVVNFLELPDPISLLQTCSYIHQFSTQRSFWLSILGTTRKKSPIACPQHTDLSQYTLQTLKDLAISWFKLRKNWNQALPRIVGPVISTPLAEDVDIIFVVPATDILLLCTAGTLLCWDAKLATASPLPAIGIDGNVTDVSGPSEGPAGITIVAFLTTSVSLVQRCVATITHEAGKAVGFTIVFSEISVPDAFHFKSLFLGEGLVGTITAIDGEKDCVVAVGEIAGSDSCADSTSVIQLPHTLPYQENMMLVSFTYQGHLYHLVEDGHSVQIQHISQKSLRSGQCEQAGVYSSDILTYTNCHSTFSMIPTTPIYGVAAVFIRCADGETLITFLPNTLTHAFDDGISSPLAFGAPCVSQMVPGEYITMWLDHSGFNAALVVESATAPTLLLVRFRPETNSVSMHTLEVPDSIDLYNPTVVCVDDAAGVVHLVDQVGIFSTLRYV